MNKRNFLTWGLIALVVLGISLTAYFLVPKFSADTIARTTTRTITVSGKVSDLSGQRPLPGARIRIKSGDGNNLYTTSDANGKYTLKLTVNPAIPDQKYLLGYASLKGYVDNQQWLTLGAGSSGAMNFSLAIFPQDLPSTKVLDSVSARCRVKSTPEDYSTWQHLGDYTGKVVNGELFCTPDNPKIFITYASQIDAASKQIKAMSIQTGLNYIPTIYLTGDFAWIPSGEGTKILAYTDGGREIVINVNGGFDMATVTHEYGHLVDWYKGWDELPSLSSDCMQNNAGTKTHCYSSYDKSFNSAFSLAHSMIIEGYASSLNVEMFAEMFAAQELAYPPGSSNFVDRQKMKTNLTNALTTNGIFPFTSVLNTSDIDTQFNTSDIETRSMLVSSQCGAKYIYKFVAAKSRLEEFFPGNLGPWSRDDISTCKYLSPAAVPVVTTKPATNVLRLTATFNGDISSYANGRGFKYGIDNSNGACTSVGAQSWALSSSGTGAFSTNATGLIPNSFYCVAAASASTASGRWVSFKTFPACKTPSVSYGGTTPIQASVTVGQSITIPLKLTNNDPPGSTCSNNEYRLHVNSPDNWDGGSSVGGDYVIIPYNQNLNPMPFATFDVLGMPNTGDSVQVTFTLDSSSGDTPSAVYSLTFKVIPAAMATTLPATNVTSVTATLNGSNIADSPYRGFYYGKGNSGGTCTFTSSPIFVSYAEGRGVFSANISGLTPDTVYCFTAVDEVNNGSGKIISFKTLSEAPSITYAGTAPNLTVNTSTRVNVPVSITNNSTHSNVVDLVVVPPTGWTITGYSANTYFRSPGLSFRSIHVESGKTVVTSVTFTSSAVPMPAAKVYIKAEMYPDPTAKLAATYQPVYVVNGSGSNTGATACTNTTPTITGHQTSLSVSSDASAPVITNIYTITSNNLSNTNCAPQQLNLSANIDTSRFPSNLTLSSVNLVSGTVSGASPISVSLPKGYNVIVTATAQLRNTNAGSLLPALPPLKLTVSKCGT